MEPPITFLQNPPCPNLSPNQSPKFPISTFFGAIAFENKVGLVLQFGINRLSFGGEGGFRCSVIGGEGGFRCSVIGGEGGFCCSVIGGYLNLVPKPAPTIVPKPAPTIDSLNPPLRLFLNPPLHLIFLPQMPWQINYANLFFCPKSNVL